jgi:hypothetical protein
LTPTATPAGWHLWHIARWADVLQASHPNRRFSPDVPWDRSRQIWAIDKLASHWGLQAERLGILEVAAGARVPVGADLMFHVTHANRHLGMIEALRGVLDLRGTATA